MGGLPRPRGVSPEPPESRLTALAGAPTPPPIGVVCCHGEGRRAPSCSSMPPRPGLVRLAGVAAGRLCLGKPNAISHTRAGRVAGGGGSGSSGGVPRSTAPSTTTTTVPPTTTTVPPTTTTTLAPEEPGWSTLSTGPHGIAIDERTFPQTDGTQVVVVRFLYNHVDYSLHVGSQDPPTDQAVIGPDSGPAIGAAERPCFWPASTGGSRRAPG